MGCTMAQGFFLGEPVAADGVERPVRRCPAAATAGAAITAIGDPPVADSQ